MQYADAIMALIEDLDTAASNADRNGLSRDDFLAELQRYIRDYAND